MARALTVLEFLVRLRELHLEATGEWFDFENRSYTCLSCGELVPFEPACLFGATTMVVSWWGWFICGRCLDRARED